jgi:hypothetical protein
MPVLFDSRGNLQASPFIELSQSETEQIFVKPFDISSKRHLLFEEYKRYTDNLRGLVGGPIYQWINGSFVSDKHSPNDIDLVSFINYEVYREREKLIDERFSKWKVADYYTGLDAFTVWTYPATHKHFVLFQADCAYWSNWFGYTRYNQNRNRFSKGFIQININ